MLKSHCGGGGGRECMLAWKGEGTSTDVRLGG